MTNFLHFDTQNLAKISYICIFVLDTYDVSILGIKEI